MNENKKKLAALSIDLKNAQKLGDFPDTENVNQALKLYYKILNVEAKTFHQWKSEGKKVKKGEKGFAVWSSPKVGVKKKEAEQQSEESYKFWNICYLFTETQVE
jgi:hypothetical protein